METRAKMQRLSDQLTQIFYSVRRFEESKLQLNILKTTEAPHHKVMYFDDKEDDEDSSHGDQLSRQKKNPTLHQTNPR